MCRPESSAWPEDPRSSVSLCCEYHNRAKVQVCTRLDSAPALTQFLGRNGVQCLEEGHWMPPPSEKLERAAQWPRSEGAGAAVSALFLLMASASLIFCFLLRLQRIRNLATVSDWGGVGSTKDLQPEKGLGRACGDSVGVEEWLLLGEGPGPS